jgi:hypothetical protein
MLNRIKQKFRQIQTGDEVNEFANLLHQVQNMKLSGEQAAMLVDAAIENAITPHHHSCFWGDRLLTIDKSAGFLQDSVFRKAYDAVRGSHQYDQYSSPQTISWRLHTLVWAAKCGLAVEGDFVECGVFKGDMSWVISQTVDFAASGKQFYLYDTYDGFSDKYSSDEDFPDNPGFIDFANQFYRDPSLYGYVCSRFKDRSDIHVVKGTVPDILQEKCPEKIAFLHIDLNSPAAEIGALEVLFPRMSKGAVLVFDDYGWKQFYRQKDAEDVYMRKLGYEILELPTGQGMVVKR